MTIFESLLLGILQGLTEFLPISSSGHLILARELLGIQSTLDLSFDAVLQLATALAVIVYFRLELLRVAKTLVSYVKRKPVETSDQILVGALALGTIPAVIAGLLLEDTMETTFRSSSLVASTLIIGALIMLLAEWVNKRSTLGELTVKKGIVIGLFQTLALIPGMSRSGMTIAGGLFSNVSREQATRFSFLLAIPIIVGSGVKKLLDLYHMGAIAEIGLPLAIGASVAFVSGLGAIAFMIRFVRNHSLMPFVVYRIVLASLILFLTGII